MGRSAEEEGGLGRSDEEESGSAQNNTHEADANGLAQAYAQKLRALSKAAPDTHLDVPASPQLFTSVFMFWHDTMPSAAHALRFPCRRLRRPVTRRCSRPRCEPVWIGGMGVMRPVH